MKRKHTLLLLSCFIVFFMRRKIHISFLFLTFVRCKINLLCSSFSRFPPVCSLHIVREDGHGIALCDSRKQELLERSGLYFYSTLKSGSYTHFVYSKNTFWSCGVPYEFSSVLNNNCGVLTA